jgi:HemK-like putative methylase
VDSISVMTTQYLQCAVMGHDIRLHRDATVFAPTLTTSFLTDQVDREMLRGSAVLDMGCGSGPIAIALALSGARSVHAVDLMPSACALARRNAALNGVGDRITVLQGDLFKPVTGHRFDLIVDDVSGIADEVARVSSWFPNTVPSGGPDGTSHTVRMLRESPAHLAPGGVLLFPVLSLSRHARVVEAAREVYGERLRKVATRQVPFNHELKSHLPALERLRSAGVIDFAQARSRHFWTLDIFQALAAD